MNKFSISKEVKIYIRMNKTKEYIVESLIKDGFSEMEICDEYDKQSNQCHWYRIVTNIPQSFFRCLQCNYFQL